MDMYQNEEWLRAVAWVALSELHLTGLALHARYDMRHVRPVRQATSAASAASGPLIAAAAHALMVRALMENSANYEIVEAKPSERTLTMELDAHE